MIALACCFFVSTLRAQEPKRGKQLPSLYLIGDSISMQYTYELSKDLQGHYKFERKNGPETPSLDIPGGSNGGDSRMVLGYLKQKYADPNFHPDILLVNAGLHDIKRNPKTNEIVITPEKYAQNLADIDSLAREHHAKLIWINTTPINDARHNKPGMGFFRYNADVQQYNKIAQTVLGDKGVSIIDLYSFTVSHDADAHRVDHAHYDKAMQILQGDYIAASLLHAQ